MGEPRRCDIVSLYHERAGSKRQTVPKEYFDCTPVAADEQRLSECQENRTPQRIYHACFGSGVSDSTDKKFLGQDL